MKFCMLVAFNSVTSAMCQKITTGNKFKMAAAAILNFFEFRDGQKSRGWKNKEELFSVKTMQYYRQ